MSTLTDHLPVSIGTALRRLRQSAGLTTAEVAERAGFSPWLLFLIENGQPLTGTGTEEVLAGIERVCEVLGLDSAPVVGGASLPAVVEADPPTSTIPPVDLNSAGQADEPTLQHRLPPPAASEDIPTPSGPGGGRRGPGLRSAGGRPAGRVRALRLASAGTALAVVASAVALVLVSGPAPGVRPPTAAAAAARTASHPTPASGPVVPGLLTTSADSATLTVGARSYRLTVTTAAPCWVEIRSAGGNVLWAGTLSAGGRETYSADQPTEVMLGAGSARMTVSWGSHRYTLTPPVAPYTYSFQS